MVDHGQFGSKLKECRKLAKLTQEELAYELGLQGGSSISHYERGDNLPADREGLDALVTVLRERGVPDDCVERLYEYAGYSPLSRIPAVAAQLIRIHDNLEETPVLFLFQEHIQWLFRIWQLYLNADADFNRGWWPDAEEGLKSLIGYIAESQTHIERLQIYVRQVLGNSLRYDGKPLEGLDQLSDAIWEARQLEKKPDELVASLLLDRGSFYRQLTNWSDAFDDYSRSRRLFKKMQIETGESQDKAIAIVERKIAATLLFQGRAMEALEHCNRSLSICIDLNDSLGIIKAEQHKAWAEVMLGRWNTGLQKHREAVTALKLRGASLRVQAKAKRFLADTYRMCGLYDRAVETYDEALEDLNKRYQGDPKKEILIRGMILFGKGGALIAQPNKLRLGSELLRESLLLHRKLNAPLNEAQARNQLSKVAIQLSEYRKAERELKNAKQIFQGLNNQYYVTAVHINKADCAFRQGKYPEARASIHSALNIAKENVYGVHLVRALIALANINLADPDEGDPGSLFIDALRTAKSLNPFLVHEALCRGVGKPHILRDEKHLDTSILQLCRQLQDGSDADLVVSDLLRKELMEVIEEIKQGIEKSNNPTALESSHGLLIGVGTYSNFRPLLKTTVDARDFRDLLIAKGYSPSRMELLLDARATKEAINEALDGIARRAKPQDVVVIFFSGHGAQRIGGLEPGEYICPVAANPNNLRATAISNKELTAAIQAIPARQVAVFLDACHSGSVGSLKEGSGEIRGGLSDKTYAQLAAGEGRVVIASCHPNEVSWELDGWRNGLFSHFLLEGLRGKAAGADGTVNIFQLFDYISREVPKHQPAQRPLFKGELDRNFRLV